MSIYELTLLTNQGKISVRKSQKSTNQHQLYADLGSLQHKLQQKLAAKPQILSHRINTHEQKAQSTLLQNIPEQSKNAQQLKNELGSPNQESQKNALYKNSTEVEKSFNKINELSGKDRQLSKNSNSGSPLPRHQQLNSLPVINKAISLQQRIHGTYKLSSSNQEIAKKTKQFKVRIVKEKKPIILQSKPQELLKLNLLATQHHNLRKKQSNQKKFQDNIQFLERIKNQTRVTRNQWKQDHQFKSPMQRLREKNSERIIRFRKSTEKSQEIIKKKNPEPTQEQFLQSLKRMLPYNFYNIYKMYGKQFQLKPAFDRKHD